jgi:hypothetical protein
MGRPLLASEEYGQAPNRAEIETEREQSLIVRAALLELQHDVYRWSIRHFDELTPDAMRDLYETIGLRVKP